MRKIIAVLLLSIILLTGCDFVAGNQQGNDNQIEKLNTPVLSYRDNVVKWNPVEDALIYLFYIDETLVTELSNCSYDISKFGYGTFNIAVVARGYNGEESNPGTLIITVEAPKVVRNNVGVFMINDTHGSVLDGDTPGMSKIGSVLNHYQKTYGDLVTVANGDIFQGSYASNILRGRPMVDVLNALDFDCFVIGNHEFDWGLDKIQAYKDGVLSNGEAEFPFLGANIYDRSTNQMVDWLEPYTIVEKNGIRVGIIGIIGHTLESSILSTFITDYEFVYPLEIIKKHTKTLRVEEECDLVIVSNHDYDEELNNAISNLDGEYKIDLILCGHTHTNYDDRLTRADGKTIVAVQNRDKNRTASFINIKVDDSQNYINFEFERVYPSDYQEQQSILEVLKQYEDVFLEGERELGTTNSYLSKNTLGYYATAAMIDEFGCDISIINRAGVRGTIDNGTITVSDVFEVFPFDNEVYLVSLLGSQIKSLYQQNSSYLYFNSDFNVQSLVNNQYYEVAVIDYVFTSPYYKEFKNVSYVDDDILLRDLLIEYIDNTY